ncbi:tetratricopeptide repeat protein [Oribacterium sp. FC2011]|uniref:tetratricopeptide repeat protein n=1 Tax=Oribacterium sp. FC2011 TaxID=1408311 RepID=UPI0009DE94CD|nr:tetratricopeptide repeat protein [Oribacterium sp. FC2011]
MNKLLKLLMNLLLVVCLCACVSNDQKIQKQLELGTKFLVDMDYEQAILAFNKVVEIDPKNTDAYMGLGDAYYGEAKNAGDYSTADTLYSNATDNYEMVMNLTSDGTGSTVNDKSLEEINQNVKEILSELYVTWSDLALKEGDSDHAAKILEDGYTILGNEELLQRSQTISDIKDAEKLIEELDVSSEDFDVSLRDNNDKIMAITDMCNGKYISTENGQGFGLYKVDGNYYVFRGSFKNGLREGLGLIMLIGDVSENYVKCEWKEDVPFGSAEYYYRYYDGWEYTTESAVFQLENGLYDGKGTTSFGGLEEEFYTLNHGMVENLGPEPYYSGYSFYSVDNEGLPFSVMQNDEFGYTRGMPGYADSFLLFDHYTSPLFSEEDFSE